MLYFTRVNTEILRAVILETLDLGWGNLRYDECGIKERDDEKN